MVANPTSNPAPTDSGRRAIKALIVGCGSIGRRHAQNLQATGHPIALHLLRRSAQPAPVDCAGATVITDIAAALRLAPDLAIVATPSALHVDVLPALIQNGIPTFVEKPIVTTSQDVDLIADTERRGPPRPHASGFNFRLLGSLIRARQAIEEGRLGTIVRASFSAGKWLPDWRPAQDYRQGYSANPSLGGGVIFDLCHEIDIARWLLGDLSILACQASRTASLGIDSPSCAQIMGRTTRGTLVTIGLDYIARSLIRRYEIVGDRATLVWDLPQRQLVLIGADGSETLTSEAADFDVAATYVAAMSQFVNQAVFGAAPTLQSLADGLISTRLTVQASDMEQTR